LTDLVRGDLGLFGSVCRRSNRCRSPNGRNKRARDCDGIGSFLDEYQDRVEPSRFSNDGLS
jgi:hypothetical protein